MTRARDIPPPRFPFPAATRAGAAVLLVLAATLAVSCAGPDRSAPEHRPPILVLALDTVRGDHLGVAGHPEIRTPHIDALAADGALFRRCLATSPWTGPSFASFYTGLLPHRHGFLGGAYSRLADDHETMAEILGGLGYRTAAFVTISWLTGGYGMEQGFAISDKRTDEGKGEQAHEITALGLEFARLHADEPFFLFLHYFDAHAPYTPPAPFDGMYYRGDARASGVPLTDFLRSDANQALNLADNSGMYDWLEGVTDPAYPAKQYAAGVSYVDEHVGRVIAGLKELEIYDEALIVLVGDHGEHLGEHGFFYTHAMPFQEVLHVPLIVKPPHGRFAGVAVETPVSIVDALPTVLDLLGRPEPDGLDGRSLVPRMEDPAAADDRVLFAEQGSSPGKFCKVAVRWPWKLMLFSVNGEFMPPVLFDLDADPLESEDFSGRRADVAGALREEVWRGMDRERPLTPRPPLEPRGVDEATKERLRALGYVH